jgi:hypothetical protein
MALVSFFMCAKTDEEARARPTRHLLPVRAALLRPGTELGASGAGTVNMWDEYNKWKSRKP